MSKGVKMDSFDVVVIGAGNAGLSAAISASQNGKKVLVVEKSLKEFRGGNSALTMNFRFSHYNITDILNLIDPIDRTVDGDTLLERRYFPYKNSEYREDLIKVSNGKVDSEISNILVKNSLHTINWMKSNGHKWCYKEKGSFLPKSCPVTIKGGGKSLQERNFKISEEHGVSFFYGTQLKDFVVKGSIVESVVLRSKKNTFELKVNSLILACGGFQANTDLVCKLLGEKWRGCSLRGVPYNTGDWYQMSIKNNIKLYGDYENCHSTPQNANMEDYLQPGQNTISQSNSRYQFQLGITVNKEGCRFFDEGEDYNNFLYAKIGNLITQQNNRVAYQIFDSDTFKLRKMLL